MKHFSILGLTLLAASTVTAAIIPVNSGISNAFAGSLTNYSDIGNGGPISSITCKPDTGTPNPQYICMHDDDDDTGGSPSETTGADLSGPDDSTSYASLPPDGGNGQNNTTSLLGS